MLINQIFKLYLYPDPKDNFYDDLFEFGEDITSGVVNVDILSGTDVYEGPYQQIDAGQFTIVSRNPNLDPKINPNLKYNSRIAFVDTRITGADYAEFFRGYVTNVNVEYVRDDNPIITITGTDIFGALQRVAVNQKLHDDIVALSTGPEWEGLTFKEFTDMLEFQNIFSSKYLDTENFNEIYGWAFYTSTAPGQAGGESFVYAPVGNLGLAPAKYIPQVGETLLDVVNKYAQSNLNYFEAKSEFGYQFINVYPFVKYNGFYWSPQIDPALQFLDYQFSSDPADGRPYESILIDNGYNKITNQLDIYNESRYIEDDELKFNSDNFVISSAESIEDYAISKASIQTIFPSVGLTGRKDRYAENIFQIVQFPSYQIQEITFDNGRYEDIQNDFSYNIYGINDFVRIKHQVNSTETIDRFYDIAGIQHNISPDKWTTTFTLKPSIQEIAFINQGEAPQLEMNATTGDTNFNFTATITNYSEEDVISVIWILNSTEPNEITLMYPTAVSGERFKDGLARSGLTQTWNFDDDGILAAYDFDTNRYGNYGAGNYTVYAYVVFKNRWTAVVQQDIVVGTPEVEADFGWVQNTTNNFGQVNFTNTSVNNEMGEPDSFFWDFGDGNTSTLQNPIHVYNPSDPSETEYDVSLTVFAYGEGEEKVYNTKTVTITLTQPAINANFNFIVDEQTVQFVNLSTNVGFEEPDAYFWDFGDGTTSTAKNPTKVFPLIAGETVDYEVTLTIRDIWERTDTHTETVSITGGDSSGNFNARYLKLRIETYTPKIGQYQSVGNTSFTLTPIMNYLKTVTSDSNINLIYLKPIQDFVVPPYTTNPGFTFRSMANAGIPLSNQGPEFYLTRNPFQLSQSQYGVGALRRYATTPSIPYSPNYYELVLDFGANTNFIKDVILGFRDLLDSNLTTGTYPWGIIWGEYYPRIWVELAETIGSLDPLPSGTVGTPVRNGNWVPIGYFQLDGGKMNPAEPESSSTRTEVTKTMVPIRPLPLNVPYFTYTFDEKIVNFYSVEEADSYLWTFGDSTTSTEKNPVKTYADYGTYNVTLEVTNDSVVTRTTTEPVIVEQRRLNQTPVRYVKFVQNEHTGIHVWDTPDLYGFGAEFQNYQIYSNNVYRVGTMTNTTEQYSVDFFSSASVNTPFDPNTGTLVDRRRLSQIFPTQDRNMRVKSLEPDFKTGWTTIVDFGSGIDKITNFRIYAGRFPAPPNLSTIPVCDGISYSVYITDYVGSSIDPNAVTWTHVGDITPTDLPLSSYKMYKLDGVNLN